MVRGGDASKILAPTTNRHTTLVFTLGFESLLTRIPRAFSRRRGQPGIFLSYLPVMVLIVSVVIFSQTEEKRVKLVVLTQILLAFSLLAMPLPAFSSSEENSRPAVSEPRTAQNWPPAAAAASTPGGLQLDIQTYVVKEHEYLPAIGRDIYTLTEENWQLRGRYDFGADKYCSLSWQETALEQKNELFDDTDFSIESKGPALGFGFPLLKSVTVTAELRVEEYQDASTDAFFQLDGSHSLNGMGGKGGGGNGSNSTGAGDDYFYSGFFETKLTRASSWTTLGYNRSRDTEPLYNNANNRAELNIRAKELTGVATGWQFAPAWEIGVSLFYEQYATGTPDQFNFNGEVSYHPQGLRPLRFSLGSGYYTEERETITNFMTSYLVKWKYADLSLQYQCEYSDNEDSFLHQGDALLKYYLSPKTSFVVSGKYGEESGGDRDRFLSLQSGLEFLF